MAINVEPQSSIKLVKCKLEKDYKNTFTFSSLSNQTTYFNGLTTKTIGNNNYAYVRKDGAVEVDEPIDTLIQYNYMYYTNTGFSNKRFYCFIDRLEYVNENCTRIFFHTDVFQTWYFQIEWNRCFVEREHVNNDSIGANTVPEDLETGEYISCDLQPTESHQPTCVFVVAVTELLFTSYTTLNQAVPSGLYYIGVRDLSDINDITNYYDAEGKADAINSIFAAPEEFFSNFQDVSLGSSVTVNMSTTVRFSTNATSINVTRVNYLGENYTPKNNKLLCYPYSFLQVSNNNGSVVNYYWEEFNKLNGGSDITFSLKGALSPGCSFTATPIDYKNILNNYDESIVLGKFPVGGWNSDVYTNWITQNGINIASSIASDVGSIALGGAMITGGASISGAGAVINGVTGIASTVGSVYKHSLIPNQARGNTNIGDYSYAYGLTELVFKRISIKNEYARIIDDFFSMFGYKVNRVKVPNITGRSQWNFIKTIDCNADGDIPQEDLETIRSACNHGITFWHNPSNIYNYSLTNSIV